MAISERPLHILGGIRDAINPPGVLWTALGRPYLTFDGTVDKLLSWSFRMPGDYASGLTVKWEYSMVSAITDNVAVRSQVMAVSSGGAIKADSFATLDKSADDVVPGTVGNMKEISFALTNVDGLAAGDYIAIQLGRENATTGTNAAGIMEVWAVSLIYTTT